jgi:hypothetical protein
VTGRRLFLDASPGEVRGVVVLDGRPERLLIERSGVERGPRLSARYCARLEELSAGLGLARLDLGEDGTAVLPLARDFKLSRGAAVEVEITAEARAGKSAVARMNGPASGPPRRLAEGPGLVERLQAAAPEASIIQGEEAREAADEAEEAALASSHELPGGLNVAIEPTRGLVAVDIDWSGPARPSARASLRANLEAIGHVARLLRLKSLGGAVVVDLVGFPRDAKAIQTGALQAFAPDQPGVVVLPVSRLGLLEIARPHRERPVGELLNAADGRLSARSVAQRLVRELQREGRADPGARITAACAPETAMALEPLLAELGPRFSAQPALGWDRLKTDIRRA